MCAPTKTPVSISTVNLSGFSGASAAKERSGLVLGRFPVRRDAGKERVTRRPSGSVGMQRGRVSAFPPATPGPELGRGDSQPAGTSLRCGGTTGPAKSLLGWDGDHPALLPAPCAPRGWASPSTGHFAPWGPGSTPAGRGHSQPPRLTLAPHIPLLRGTSVRGCPPLRHHRAHPSLSLTRRQGDPPQL